MRFGKVYRFWYNMWNIVLKKMRVKMMNIYVWRRDYAARPFTCAISHISSCSWWKRCSGGGSICAKIEESCYRSSLFSNFFSFLFKENKKKLFLFFIFYFCLYTFYHSLNIFWWRNDRDKVAEKKKRKW